MVKKSSKKTGKINAEQKLDDNKQNQNPDEQEMNITEEEAGKDETTEEEDKVKSDQEFLLKIAELQDKYIRLSAEFDNYRKRTLKERTDLIKSAGGDLIVKLLPIMDDFERALSSMGEAKDIDAVKTGVSLIYTKFRDLLNQQGVKEIEAVNKDFDTDVHEAITKIPAPEEKLKGKIVEVVEKGYYLNDKIIRYAKVVIGE